MAHGSAASSFDLLQLAFGARVKPVNTTSMHLSIGLDEIASKSLEMIARR